MNCRTFRSHAVGFLLGAIALALGSLSALPGTVNAKVIGASPSSYAPVALAPELTQQLQQLQIRYQQGQISLETYQQGFLQIQVEMKNASAQADTNVLPNAIAMQAIPSMSQSFIANTPAPSVSGARPIVSETPSVNSAPNLATGFVSAPTPADAAPSPSPIHSSKPALTAIVQPSSASAPQLVAVYSSDDGSQAVETTPPPAAGASTVQVGAVGVGACVLGMSLIGMLRPGGSPQGGVQPFLVSSSNRPVFSITPTPTLSATDIAPTTLPPL